jgi:2-hydroxychromene-2-carboxylate isomerase
MSSLKLASTAPLAVIAGEDADYERLDLARDAARKGLPATRRKALQMTRTDDCC